MLWLVCVFNYADRQAIFSVFPRLKAEMGLDDIRLGVVGGAFMWVYAAALPFAGAVADRANRKALILGGLLFWSAVTLATGWATEYWHLVLFRAMEGLGEAFYFPASMSLLSDYHGPATRSRAMGLHQSSVYVGTVLGGAVAGYCADYYGWRSGFYLFGGLGVVLAAVLLFCLCEPTRGAADGAPVGKDEGGRMKDESKQDPPSDSVRLPIGGTFRGRLDVNSGEQAVGRPPLVPPNISRTPSDSSFILHPSSFPMALVLTAVFVGANFVAVIFLTWMPSYLNRAFGMSLTMAGLNATLWLQAASVAGVLCGGWLADRWARRRRGGRPLVQALGLLVGAPVVFLTGWARDVNVLVAAMAGFGFFKGLYDANIWASLYDVVPARRRATAQGLMNAVGWLGGGVAPVAIAAASARYGMAACLSATSAIYLVFGGLLVAGTAVFFPRPPSPSYDDKVTR
jgi:MFS family permease